MEACTAPEERSRGLATEERRKNRAAREAPCSHGAECSEASSSSLELSPKEAESHYINSQDSILGDKPYILPNGEVYKKRVRTVMTPMQSETLKRYFKVNSFPSAEDRAAISGTLGMKPRTVQVWFQNQRQKMKQMIQEEEKIKNLRQENTHFEEKGEETLWVLAKLSCAVLNINDVM
ncbi:hypothetical protein NEDG_01594 [Nematocida displodere]|uniref:Homeobox domain-containing protein n=1 Tax=Nematocida displodere TaxID=1805483 RepID=A0A177EI84_9MICR|nr:hypothetical protein NEDG_01594 [Nematocida displodere]